MTKLAKIATYVSTSLASVVVFAAPVAAATNTLPYTRLADNSLGTGVSLIILLCVCVLSVVILGLKIYLIVDAVNRDYGDDHNMMLVGILFLLFLGFPIGDIIYWVLIMQKYPKKK